MKTLVKITLLNLFKSQATNRQDVEVRWQSIAAVDLYLWQSLVAIQIDNPPRPEISVWQAGRQASREGKYLYNHLMQIISAVNLRVWSSFSELLLEELAMF